MSQFLRVGNLYVPRTLDVSGHRLAGLPKNIDARVFATQRETCLAMASHFKARVDAAALRGEQIRLGLQTGNTPIFAYQALWKSDWSHVHTWNLDEYFPMKSNDPQSYHQFMWKHLFAHIKINPAHVHIPCGDPEQVDPHVESERYEASIRQAGDLDVQGMGLGRTGHIGFNEPGSSFDSPTRLVDLAPATLEDARNDFRGRTQPTQGITVGLATAMRAREIVMIVTGPKTTAILPRVFLEPPTPNVPASILQGHPNVKLFADRVAAEALLTRLAGRCGAPGAR